MKLALLTVAALTLTAFPAAADHAADPPGDCQYHPGSRIAHGTTSRDVVNLHDGSGFDDCYDARDGNDDVFAQGGLDNVWGGNGNDLLDGGAGGDGMNGEAGTDELIGRDGHDTMYGGGGNDTLSAQEGPDDLFGGGFCNETDHYGFDSFPEYDVTNVPCGGGGSDVLQGGPGNDWLWESNSDQVGDNEVDQLWGGGGYDICTIEAIDTAVDCEEVHIVP
jgi:Ca2+-binding RTX toxin-like protein